MKRIEIGRVIQITNTDIEVEILRKFESSYVIIDATPIRISGVGKFVKVGSQIYQIQTEKVFDIESKEANGKIIVNKRLNCSLIGFFDNKEFKEGTNADNPDLFQKVYKVTLEEERLLYSRESNHDSIKLGYYILNKEIDFNIDINKLFASHLLIVGNTGSGKSNTLAKLYEELFNQRGDKFRKSKSKFLIVDSNGEYKQAFTSKKSNLINWKLLDTNRDNESNLKIPIRSLNEFDWKILLEATDKTQFPLLKNVIQGVKKYIYDSNSNNRILNHINKKIQYSLVAIIDSSENVNSKMSGFLRVNDLVKEYLDDTKSNELKKNNLNDYVESIKVNSNRIMKKGSNVYDDESSLLKRTALDTEFIDGDFTVFSVNELGLLLNLEFIIRSYKYSVSDSNISPMIARFNSSKSAFLSLFYEYKIGSKNYEDLEYLIFNVKPIAVCDVSLANKTLTKSIVTLLAAKLYEKAIEMRNNDEKFSYHIIVDEAHNYLSRNNISKEDAISESCIETFEKIIKEGRKFNTFLTMSTQRPSDITSTLLSQAHNYIIHKLVNPNDISVVSNTVPFLDNISMKMIPILSPGQAIFAGTAFHRASIVQVDRPNYEVKSSTIDLVDLWK